MSLSASEIERIAQRTAELVAGAAPQTTLSIEGVMAKLNCESLTATFRLAKVLKIRPYARGKYRMADVDAAIARASFNAQRRAA